MTSTPNAKRTNAYNDMLTEKGTVDRAIEIENRIEEIQHSIEWCEEKLALFGSQLAPDNVIAQHIEELESELSDLQDEYRG